MWLLMTRVGRRQLSAEHRRKLEEVQVSLLTFRSGFALRARHFLAAKKYRKKHALNLIQWLAQLPSHFVVPCAAQPNARTAKLG